MLDSIVARSAGSGCFTGFMGHYGGISIFTILIGVIVIIGAIWLIKEITSNNNDTTRNITSSQGGSTEERPEEIARKRLAKGEITREEFEDIMSTLKENN